MTEEEDTIHPVVRLLVARMESHPEEFYFDSYWSGPHPQTMPAEDRWHTIMENVRGWASPEEIRLLNKPFLDAAHRAALDELLNGPERRAQERREREEEHRRWQQQMLSQRQAPGALSGLGNYQQYQNALEQNALARSYYEPISDTVRVPGGGVTSDEGIVDAMKKMLGLK